MEFPRLQCPFCDAENQVRMISPGPDAPRWVESCAACKSYLKMVDERKLPAETEVIPLVEEVATLYLDFIAEKQGCRPTLPYVAMR